MVLGAKRLGYVDSGAKRLGLKIEAKRLGGKRPGGKRLGGETSCYRLIQSLVKARELAPKIVNETVPSMSNTSGDSWASTLVVDPEVMISN